MNTTPMRDLGLYATLEARSSIALLYQKSCLLCQTRTRRRIIVKRRQCARAFSIGVKTRTLRRMRSEHRYGRF